MTCITQRCSSHGYAFEVCKIEEVSSSGRIISVDVKNRLSNSNCKLNESFGYNDTSIWVDKGCRADFKVCYQQFSTPMITSTTTTTTDSLNKSDSSAPVLHPSAPAGNLRDKTNSTGLIAGIVVGVIIVVIAVVVLIILLRRFPNKFKRRKESKESDNNDVCNQAAEVSSNNTPTYTSLQEETYGHQYADLDKEKGNIPSYMTVYDSNCPSATNYILHHPINNAEYDQVESNHLHSQLPGEVYKHYDYAECSIGQHNSEPSAVTAPDQYAILDPRETGFNRTTVNIYELTKHSSQTSKDNPYVPSPEGVYDHAHENRLQKNKGTINTHIYSHSSDDVYDSSEHKRQNENKGVYYGIIDATQ